MKPDWKTFVALGGRRSGNETMKSNNHIIVDLNKVSYAELLYVTHSLGRTYKRHKKPAQPTVNGNEFDCSAKRPLRIALFQEDIYCGSTNTEETMLEYAKCRNLIDRWHPELTLQLSNNHSLVYIGSKALVLWEAWRKKIFKPTKQKEY